MPSIRYILSCFEFFDRLAKAATRLTLRSTYKSYFAGIAPTGKQVTVAAILITQFIDGKEAEAWDLWDTGSFL
jgi:predicted ester cyclase